MKKMLNKSNLNNSYQQILQKVYNDEDVKKFINEHRSELTDVAIKKSASSLYEFINKRDNMKNGRDQYAKGYEPRLEINNHLIEVTYQPTQAMLQAAQQQTIKNNVQAIGLAKNLKDAKLDDFYQENERIDALNNALNFISKYENSSNGFEQGIYLSGSFGVGKSYLLSAIANKLANDNVKSMFIHFPSFATKMKSLIGSGNNSVADELDRVKTVPVLMIDDIGADSMSTWIRDEILGVILEYRMQNQLPTFFSSNFSMEQLEEEHLAVNAKGDYEPLKAKRLMERIHFLARPIEMGGENRRNR